MVIQKTFSTALATGEAAVALIDAAQAAAAVAAADQTDALRAF